MGLESLAASGSSCTLWLGFLQGKCENGVESAHLGMPTALLSVLTFSLNSEKWDAINNCHSEKASFCPCLGGKAGCTQI